MMGDAPEDYELSKREELAPLVRDFHELVSRDLTDAELLALDFALEWVFQWAEDEFENKLLAMNAKMDTEYAVTYGMLPTIRLMEVPNLEIAKKIAGALRGQVRVRRATKWELFRETE